MIKKISLIQYTEQIIDFNGILSFRDFVAKEGIATKAPKHERDTKTILLFRVYQQKKREAVKYEKPGVSESATPGSKIPITPES